MCLLNLPDKTGESSLQDHTTEPLKHETEQKPLTHIKWGLIGGSDNHSFKNPCVHLPLQIYSQLSEFTFHSTKRETSKESILLKELVKGKFLLTHWELQIADFDLYCLFSSQWIKLECKSAVWLPSKHWVGKEPDMTHDNNNEILSDLWLRFSYLVQKNTHKKLSERSILLRFIVYLCHQYKQFVSQLNSVILPFLAALDGIHVADLQADLCILIGFFPDCIVQLHCFNLPLNNNSVSWGRVFKLNFSTLSHTQISLWSRPFVHSEYLQRACVCK